MSSIPTLLADHLAGVINTAQDAAAFGALEFTAQRSYPDWDDDFTGLKNLAVDVVFVSSGNDEAALEAAYFLQTEIEIDIAVRKRFDHPSEKQADGRLKNSTVDALVSLVEQIHVLLAEDRNTAITLVAGTTANWMGAIVRTYCDYAKLRQGVFLGVVRVKFDVSKAVN
jgi:hypothetical protein